ncbi:MAG TPA: DUF2231 domain-containing protein, partial [Candidatus Binataceae bacterium]
MDTVVNFLKTLHLHPVADHFTISLIIVAVLVDLVASIAPTRLWLRYMAATLMVAGAIAAAASWVTGDWEADRLWDAVHGPGKEVLKNHAQLGGYLVWVFGFLALWRLIIQAFGFAARSRPIYLILAIIASGAVGYQAYRGGEMVFTYGIGTELTAVAATSSPAASASAAAPVVSTPIPTVSVPTPTDTATP